MKNIGLLIRPLMMITLLTAILSSSAQECNPPCRRGYVCEDGECISACNPPCGPGERCDPVNLECIPVSNKSETDQRQAQVVPAASTTLTQTGTALMQPGPALTQQSAAQPGTITTQPSTTPIQQSTVSVSRTSIEPFQKGYFEISCPMNFHTFGTLDADYYDYDYDYSSNCTFSQSANFLSGVRLAGYGALKAFHIGGYFMFQAGEGELDIDYADDEDDWEDFEGISDITLMSVGLSMKLGGLAAERVFIGGGLDVGVNFLKADEWEKMKREEYIDEDTMVGLQLFPRFCIDILSLNAQGFKLAVPISAGVLFTPISGQTFYEDEYEDVTATALHVSPILTIGIAFGG